MSALADRLRTIVGASAPARGSADRRGGPSAAAVAARLRSPGIDAGSGQAPPQRAWDSGERRRADPDAAAEILDGAWVDVDGHRFLLVERTYRPGYRHGRRALVDQTLPEGRRWLDVLLGRSRPAGEDAGSSRSRVLFVDLETTGLAGGAGTYACLVGCGWFEGVTFRVRQLFLSSYPAERVLLESLAALAASTQLVVSYNGTSFDLPLIDTRFVMHRMETPFAGLPHLDMLHHARRLWRPDETDDEGEEMAGSCRLADMERTVCGHVRDGDVPGFDIPGRYFHFVRTGDARPMAAVLEHNRLDLLSLACLTARAAQLVEDGPAGVTSVREALGLGRLHERAGCPQTALACLHRACGLEETGGLPGTVMVRAEALRAYALLCRRQRHHRDAAWAWQRLVELPGCPPRLFREAAEALAVHHEHRLRDPRTARDLAVRSMPLQQTASRRQALEYRLARLERKLEGTAGAGLF